MKTARQESPISEKSSKKVVFEMKNESDESKTYKDEV